MAASKIAKWTVLVVVDEDDSLTGMYRMQPETKLSELLEMWKEDFEVFGHWVFVSAIDKVTLNNSLTLEMVGEAAPGIVNLRAKLIDEPTSEIFVHLKDECHNVSVKPHDRLFTALWQIPREPERFEHNGSPLNIKHTVQQAGLQNKSVIIEPLRSITVRLSSGYARVFEVPSNSLVWHLKEKVNIYETSDFSLMYQGRCLKYSDSVKQLTQVVEVTTSEFIVNVLGRRITWGTTGAPITFSEFVSQLAVNGKINTQELETLEFACTGCQRHVRQSEDYVQHLPVDCCKEKSLVLDAIPPPGTGSSAENDFAKHVKSFHEHMMKQGLKNSTSTSRSVCRQMKKCTEEGLDYNILTRCLLKTTNELQEKIKNLEAIAETLKTKNFESDEEIKKLNASNIKSSGGIKKLEQENKRLIEEKKELEQEKRTLIEEKKELEQEKRRLADETIKLKNEQNAVSLKKNTEGATAVAPFRPPTAPSEEPVRDLAIVFLPGRLKLKPPHKVRGKYFDWKFTFVNDSGLSSSPTFPEIKEFLYSIFVDARPIRRIRQIIGFSKDGKKAVWGTTIDGAVTSDWNALDCCDADGKRYRWPELERVSRDVFRENDGKRLLLTDGDCRTALFIRDD